MQILLRELKTPDFGLCLYWVYSVCPRAVHPQLDPEETRNLISIGNSLLRNLSVKVFGPNEDWTQETKPRFTGPQVEIIQQERNWPGDPARFHGPGLHSDNTFLDEQSLS